MWKSLTPSMRKCQRVISKLSVEWCLAMTYLGKKDDHKLGTTNWESYHYLGFTRLSLYHVSPLDGSINLPEGKKEGTGSLQENPGPVVLSNVKHVGRRNSASENN